MDEDHPAAPPSLLVARLLRDLREARLPSERARVFARLLALRDGWSRDRELAEFIADIATSACTKAARADPPPIRLPSVPDLVQEVLWRIFDRRPRIRGDPAAYVATVTRNLVKRSLHGRDALDHAVELPVALPDPHPLLPGPPYRPGPEPMWGPEVAKALGALPARLRTVVELRFLEELSFELIAERLGITPENTRQRLARALIKLRLSPVVLAMRRAKAL